MSNTTVGNIYQQIISDVCDSSRVDFEEGGVDEQVLEELRQVWLWLTLPLSAHDKAPFPPLSSPYVLCVLLRAAHRQVMMISWCRMVFFDGCS